MHLLYRTTDIRKEVAGEQSAFLSECQAASFKPHPFRLRISGECVSGKALLGRLYFWLITAGTCQIWYLRHDNEVIHTSYVIPRCVKFPFLGEGDYEIGPCVTNENYRSRGVYRYMLRLITASDPDAVFYMIVRDSNVPSIKGIEAAGFQLCGKVKRTRFLKNYYKENDEHGRGSRMGIL